MIQMQKEGQWSNFLNGLQGWASKSASARTKIVKKAAVIGSTLMKKNMASGGALVGAPFAPNSQVTADMKGSSKPLIDTGEFMGSITQKVIDSETSFAGVLKMSIHGANIPAIHENGTNRAGRGHKVTIPARPWMKPVAESALLKNDVKNMAESEHQKLMKDLFGI
jgi:phage gpG-like protein